MLTRMKSSVPARIAHCGKLSRLGIFAGGLLVFGACSKTNINMAGQASPQPILMESNRNKAADRVVEIDRLLALPLTGKPEESDRRTALRAERAALVASGQVPYELRGLLVASHNVAVPVNNTVTQRSANGNVVNYAEPPGRVAPIVVAPIMQSSNLSFLEQMTPTEREHYYKNVRLQNSQRVDVNVRHN
jgi:hypothetical protein